MINVEKFYGAFIGLAVGDAIGMPLEAYSARHPPKLMCVIGMAPGGPEDLPAGYWTDDTSMALCMAASLIEKGGFDPKDQLDRYVRWYYDGYMTPGGKSFGTGLTTINSIREFKATGKVFRDPPEDPKRAGNGTIMRLAPIPMFFFDDAESAISISGESARTTHGAMVCVDAARYMGAILYGALNGASKEELLSDHYSPIKGYWKGHQLCKEIGVIASGSYKKDGFSPNPIGMAVQTLENALWAFNSTDSFRDGMLKIVNLGGDSDTNGAVFGQIAGAFYGKESIPKKWIDALARKDMIIDTVERLRIKAEEKEKIPSKSKH
ncbi:MAG: ADP-ribosylglycohydrolase family protein [Candidatus Marsarchaeota archaeon]|nr:ADP-ribosylglycohydrolase family protein [Candidatus Marsarchaeota archaeon]